MPGAAVIALVAALAQPVPVRLNMTYEPSRGAPRTTATLVCGTSTERAGGYLRKVGAHRACLAVRRRKRTAILSHQPDPSRVCSQVFGGPERAHVTGRIGTRRVDRLLARRDSCETAEWDAIVPLVPAHQDGA